MDLVLNRANKSGGYNVRDPKSDGNKGVEGKPDPKKGPYNDTFSREGQKNKPHQGQYQNPHSKKFSVAVKTVLYTYIPGI